MKVFLDMDGVLVDFVGGIHDALCVEYDLNKYPYPLGKWDVFEEMEKRPYYKRTKGEVFRKCATARLWEDLVWMHDGQHILKACVESAGKSNLFICSKPMMGAESWSGKIQWLKNNGIHRNIILIDATKSLLAHPDCILIDDRDKNVDEFIAAGGKAFLIPRPWNRGFTDWKAGKPFMDELRAAIRAL